MSDDVGSHGVPTGRTGYRRRRRTVALAAAGALLPLLAGCTDGDTGGAPPAGSQDVTRAAPATLRDGGTVRWAVDALPDTYNAFQAEADAGTDTVAGAVLPALFTLDARGTPQMNADYLRAAEVTERGPKQVVRYRLNPHARWSDGRRISAADFAAQWKALRGRDSGYRTARNAGYDRIERVRRGGAPGEVEVTFAEPYADWESLFTPLYPKSVMGSPKGFNDRSRERLKPVAGPFRVTEKDGKGGKLTLVRNERWWGDRARLDRLVLTELPQKERAAALAAGTVDVAGIDRAAAAEIAAARGEAGPGAGGDDAPGAGTAHRAAVAAEALRSQARLRGTEAERAQEKKRQKAAAAAAERRERLRGYTVHKALEPSATQLAINGSTGPLADERVRRAVARAVDRKALAKAVLGPLGLPTEPVGSHLLLAAQPGYRDGSGALGAQDTVAAQALLADAGWRPPAAGAEEADADNGRKDPGDRAAGAPGAGSPHGGPAAVRSGAGTPLAGLVGARSAGVQRAALLRQSAALYRTAARGAHRSAEGDRASAAYAKYLRADERAHTARDAADALEAVARREDTALAAGPDRRGWDDTKPAARHAEQAGTHAGAEEVAGTGPAGPLSAAQVGAAEDAAERNRAAAGTGDEGKAGSKEEGAAAGKGAGVFVKKDGKPLTLRFVLPGGPGTGQLRMVADRISAMLAEIGVRTAVQRVDGTRYFEDHIAAGDYDLALYSWPGTAYPATDTRPVYAKPRPGADGSLAVGQNYTRVGTDRIDQLLDQAGAELDEDAAHDLMAQADARIWAAAGSVPLYQRPELVAARSSLANVGAFGFATPRLQAIGYKN